MNGDGHLEDVLEVKFWRGIRERRVYRNVRVDGDMMIVKRVRIGGRLHREGHGNRRRVGWGERRRMMEGRLIRVSRSGRSERSREIVGEGSPVKGSRGRVDDRPGRGGRHRIHSLME